MAVTITKLLFDIELEPLERSTGVAYLHDAHLDDGQVLAVDARVELRDEGGRFLAAMVEAIEPTKFGNKYRLRIQP